MVEFAKKHWPVIVPALILGVLMVLPIFYFEIKLGKDYKGILPEIVDDENFYYARIKDIVDGHPFLGNAYLSEHKNELPQQLFLAEYLLAQPLNLFHISIQESHLIYNFFLPFLAFILSYGALYLITRSRLGAIIFSSFLFFGLYLLAFIRPISPQFNFIFWLAQFIFLWLFVSERKNKWLWLSIVNFGILFYVYPYYWTFYLIFFGILAAIYFCKSRELAFRIAAVAAGGLVLAIPYFYFNYLSSQSLYYTETLTRLGMIYSRFPSGFRIVFWSALGILAFGWFLRRKIITWDEKTIFFVSGILASVIAVNQHLLTGKNFEFSSHYDMGAIFFLIFSFAYLWSNLKDGKKPLSALLIFIALIAITNGLFGFLKKAFAANEQAVYCQNYSSVLGWLNKNTKKDSVVYANPGLSRLIPVYTADNVYYVREANLFFISDKEVLDRFIINNFFERFNEDFIIKNIRSIYGVRYIDTYGHAVQGNKLRRLLGINPEPEIYLPENAVQKVLSRAQELQSGDFTKELSRYKIDYLIWDKNKNPDWRINQNAFKKVFEDKRLLIFELN